MPANNQYVIITPAYNEAENLQKVIESVIQQTILPSRWIIIDDGSTDNTASIIQSYADKYHWIKYIRREKEPNVTYYSSNVYAILRGIEAIVNMDYDYLAILDADIILCADYYQQIFERFRQYPTLGIATGTYFETINGIRCEAKIDRMSTPKAIQVFRKKCYHEIGGYLPMKYGGEDSCAEVMARMEGWHTWSFNDIHVDHLRPVGTRNASALLKARFGLGLTDYSIGTHPLFMLVKAGRRCLTEKPYVSSGLARLLGFVYGYFQREPRQVPIRMQSYLRKEQIRRLKRVVGVGEAFWRPIP